MAAASQATHLVAHRLSAAAVDTKSASAAALRPHNASSGSGSGGRNPRRQEELQLAMVAAANPTPTAGPHAIIGLLPAAKTVTITFGTKRPSTKASA